MTPKGPDPGACTARFVAARLLETGALSGYPFADMRYIAALHKNAR